jgi:folate-binding protein YgfZ
MDEPDRLDYEALRNEVGAAWLSRDVIRVSGPDAVSYLQGQLSQDVENLSVGASAEALLLSPQGKIDALVRVTRTDDDEILMDVDGGYGDAVIERLRRFKLRTKADIESAEGWRCLSLRGPAVADLGLGSRRWDGLTLPADWPGLPGVDLLGTRPSVPEGVRECGMAAWEAVRIEAGIPRMGAELTERTIPAEAGVVERTVSFTKGCFTGQELVARIDSRGSRVPRHLRGVVMSGSGDIAPSVGAVVGGRAASVSWVS